MMKMAESLVTTQVRIVRNWSWWEHLICLDCQPCVIESANSDGDS